MLKAGALLQMGVFAVILQQLNCSLGYVYVSHAQASSILTATRRSCFVLQSSNAGGPFAGASIALLGRLPCMASLL